MLLALTGYQAALIVVAACFILFALAMALLVPRSRPSFPGNRLGLFLAVCGVFFVAQISAVLVLAEIGEADEPAKGETTGARVDSAADRVAADPDDRDRDDRSG